MDKYDVIKRAIEIADRGGATEDFPDCEKGIWCPFCLMAEAQGELQEGRELGYLAPALRNLLPGMEEEVLIEARDALEEITGKVDKLPPSRFTKKRALSALKKAVNGQSR